MAAGPALGRDLEQDLLGGLVDVGAAVVRLDGEAGEPVGVAAPPARRRSRPRASGCPRSPGRRRSPGHPPRSRSRRRARGCSSRCWSGPVVGSYILMSPAREMTEDPPVVGHRQLHDLAQGRALGQDDLREVVGTAASGHRSREGEGIMGDRRGGVRPSGGDEGMATCIDPGLGGTRSATWRDHGNPAGWPSGGETAGRHRVSQSASRAGTRRGGPCRSRSAGARLTWT